MTEQEFKNQVMGFKGKYPERELLKFFFYYTQRKHFSTFPKWSLARRLTTWFSSSRNEQFKEKNKGNSPFEKQLAHLKSKVHQVNPLR